MIQVRSQAALSAAAPLFDGWQETLIWSALQGIMGEIWQSAGTNGAADAAICVSGDFWFFAGNAQTPNAEALTQAAKQKLGASFAILVPQNEAWGTLIGRVFGQAANGAVRYAFDKDTHFDTDKLKAYVSALPEGLRLRKIDRAIYEETLRNRWTYYFCSRFGSPEAYAEHGHGIVCLQGEALVGGASSYSYYLNGIEIEVQTRTDMRRQGIALACCAQLILDCLSLGLYPSWDASNLHSVALAEKLGYKLAGTYPIFYLNLRS